MGGVATHAFFRELLLVEGVAQQGLGNWQAVAEHVGTRTKEEVEEHYNTVYVDSPNWPRPVRIFKVACIPTNLGDRFSVWTYLLISILQNSKNENGVGYPI
jgi:hypothetical protein